MIFLKHLLLTYWEKISKYILCWYYRNIVYFLDSLNGKRRKKWGVGGENLTLMKLGGMLVKLFSYLFFIISLFLTILIKLLWYKFFKVNIISYYKFIILFLIIKLLIINYDIAGLTIRSTPVFSFTVFCPVFKSMPMSIFSL